MKHWHNRCTEEYKFIFWPQVTRQRLCTLRQGKCEDCGEDVARLGHDGKTLYPRYMAEHHHIIPLVDYVHDPVDPYAAWREGNLALLCHVCHQKRHAALRLEKKPQMRLAI